MKAAGLGTVLGSVVATDAHLRGGTLGAVSDIEVPAQVYPIYCDSRRTGEQHVRTVHLWLLETTAGPRPT